MKLLNFFLPGIQFFAVVFSIEHIWGDNNLSIIEWLFWFIAGVINASGLIDSLKLKK